MEIAIDEKTRLQVRRVYKAPVANVYAAWTDPEQVKHWMGPSDDFGEAEVTSDIRVGGRYRIVMHAPDGEFTASAACIGKSCPTRSSSTHGRGKARRNASLWSRSNSNHRATGPSSSLTHEQFADSEARDKHQHGWNGCMERFGRYLSR